MVRALSDSWDPLLAAFLWGPVEKNVWEPDEGPFPVAGKNQDG